MFEQYKRRCLRTFAFVFVMMLYLVSASARIFAQQAMPMEHDHAVHAATSMAMEEPPADPAAKARLEAKIRADKQESEFNHHLAGFFVVLAAVFMLFESTLTTRCAVAKYAWPACFLLAGIFVLVWSDTELWPFGHRQWAEALQNNPEVLQHKTFAVLLLALGVAEWLRARGVLKAAWSAWVFPAAAVIGSVILIFHHHEGGMVGEHHMETMARIQSEHMSYTVSGLAIALSKGLSEIRSRSVLVFSKLWPVLMIVLGVLLMFYRE